MVPPEQKQGPVLKENIRAAAIAVLLVAAGLFWWQVTAPTDCPTVLQTNASAGEAFFSGCRQSGSANSGLSAMLAPLFRSAAAEQRHPEVPR